VGTTGTTAFSCRDAQGDLTGFRHPGAPLAEDWAGRRVCCPAVADLVTQLQAGAFRPRLMSGVTVRPDPPSMSRLPALMRLDRCRGGHSCADREKFNRLRIRSATCAWVNAGGHLEQVARQKL